MAGGVVEIIAAGPDSVPLPERPVLRRAVTDSSGAWRLSWLPATGERWLLRAFDDPNNDRRAAESEAIRLWPDTLSLTGLQPRLNAGLRVVYRPTTPGQLVGQLAGRPDSVGAVMAFVLAIAETDTGHVPVAQPPGSGTGQAVPDTGSFTLVEAGPGLVRAVFFVDLDGDSLLSAFGQPADTLWSLEPWALVDSLEVEPGLPTTLPAPAWPDTLTPWPAPVAPDTALALPDSLAALVDSLTATALDSLAAAGLDSLAPQPADTADAPGD
jgi:hypothetical protein